MRSAFLIALLSAFFGLNMNSAQALQLDSSQQRTLNDALFYMKDVDKQVPKVTQQADDLKAGKIQLDRTGLHRAMNEVSYAGSKLDNVFTRLNQLPSSAASVAELKRRATSRAQELLAAEAIFQAAQDNKQKAAARFSYEELREDQDRLREFSGYFTQPEMLWNSPEYCLEPVRNLPKTLALRNELEKKYASILGDTQGQSLRAQLDGFDYALNQFREAYPTAADQLVAQAKRALEDAQRIADIAKQRQSPSGFTNGSVAGSEERARVAIALLEAIGDPKGQAKSLKAEHESTSKKLRAAQVALTEQIIAANEVPSQLYGAADAKELLTLAYEAWTKAHPNQEVLALRIPMSQWERRAGWRWALDEFQRHDESNLQVALIVSAPNEKHAHVYYAHLRRDHLAGDRVDLRLDDAGEVPAYRILLRSRLDG